MKRIAIILFVILSPELYGSGFDDTILWIYDLPESSSNSLNTEPRLICDSTVQVSVLYSRPYRIDELSWNNAFVKKGFGRWGLFGRFNSYGMKRYYNDYIYEAGIAVILPGSLAASVAGEYHYEQFDAVGGFARGELDARLSYRRGAVSANAGISGLVLQEEYKIPGGRKSRPWGSVSALLNKEISLSAGVRKFENGRVRWLFCQRARLSSELSLSFGVINRPDVIFGRLIVAHGSFSLDLAFYSISRLNDTAVLGLTYGG